MARLRSAKRLRPLRPGSKKSRSLRTRGTFMVEICTGGKVTLHVALAGSGAPVQTNGLRIQARQRYASKAAVLCIQSQQGVLEPLLVRELEERNYQVVIGARRLRAAKIAELDAVPVRVVKLSDAEAIEAQVVENLQREGIHPLEEALGFRSLLELKDGTYTVASIAARAGKSEAYVYSRVKLTELTPPVAEAFLNDKITTGHALLIAKLPAAQQQEAFAASFRSMWTSEGNTQVLIPVRELAAWIESNIFLELDAAPFDKQNETLATGAWSSA